MKHRVLAQARQPACCLAALLAAIAGSLAADAPPVKHPRATLGDTVVEPAWAQRLTVTVGPADADIVGTSQKPIQAAEDYVARLGGGTVKILPGTYRLRNAVYLQPKVRLIGSGSQTVLIKEPSVTTTLAQDSDWFDQEITLTDATGFEIGDGVCLRTKNPGTGATEIVKRTLVARTGNRFKLDQGLRKNFWRIGDTKVSTLFPILSGENVSDIVIEDLVLDGNRAKNDNLDGNYAGCIFMQECNRVTIRGVTARNYNGDGMSWQICHDVLVENCVSEGHAGLGLHPGSGSQRTVMRNNRVIGNNIGIFFCWGVRHGLAEQNHIEGNRTGISIGHHDTDNLVTGNQIIRNEKVGVLFRPERGKDFAGHRNRIENNRLVDNGPENGPAVDIQGGTESVVLANNEIIETRGPAQRSAIRLGPETRDIRLEGNRIRGFAKDVDRKP
ncbi:MAG: right-handed parallel beta-helix repeat-containing protein [Verrucomicrobiae bacterium]|nr:right-handed parallel beta-helix repeat-containing protein [Verrucomicrobiae bacterium]